MIKLFAQEWAQALGWALLHAVWQLALIGLVAWVYMRFSTSQPAYRRYNAMAGWLVLCLFVVAGTFMYYLLVVELSASTIAKSAAPAVSTSAAATDIQINVAGKSARLSAWMDEHLHWFTLAWLVGVFALSIRALGACVFLQYLRWEGAAYPAVQWQRRFQALKNQMGITQAVGFLESAIVKAPVAFGFFKPVILIPAGWLAQLPPEQLEALLLHELAHVRRLDFLVNIVLSTIAILLFYHPVVHWLSARIGELREESCDDQAVAGGANPIAFAESLLAIVNHKKIAFAMNATSFSSHFSHRIQRLIAPPVVNQTSRFTLMPFLTSFSIVVAILFAGLLSAQTPAVSVSADKMNVLYIGVDNPLTVAVAGVPSENIKLYSKELKLTDKGNGNYIALASRPGTAAIQVEAGNKVVREMQFRVKRIPNPTAVYNGFGSGAVTPEEFKKYTDLNVFLPSDYDGMNCKVSSCSIVWVRPKTDPIEAYMREGEFNAAAKKLIEAAAPGDFYYFEDIKAQCPGGEIKLNSLVFRIVEQN